MASRKFVFSLYRVYLMILNFAVKEHFNLVIVIVDLWPVMLIFLLCQQRLFYPKFGAKYMSLHNPKKG